METQEDAAIVIICVSERNTLADSVVLFSVEFDPPRFMRSSMIFVGPMHCSAFFGPLVLAMNCHEAARGYASDARRDVNVVGNQNGNTRRQPEDEPLMAVSGRVVR